MTSNSIQEATAAQNNSLQKKDKPVTMQDYIKKMAPEIEKALPSVITPERFTRITLSALSANPTLQQCSPKSFLGAMMTAAQLGVEPNTPLGQAYLIPFKNKGKIECQFQLGYKGLIDLAYRSGEIQIIQAHTVYENDEFEYELGLDPVLKHVPYKGADKGSPVYFYAVFKLKNGGYGFEVMSAEEVRAHAKKYSQSFGSDYSPWKTNFEEMAKKTVLKKALKYAPMKSDFVRQADSDGTVKDQISDDMFAVSPVYYETDAYDVDEETGEVSESA